MRQGLCPKFYVEGPDGTIAEYQTRPIDVMLFERTFSTSLLHVVSEPKEFSTERMMWLAYQVARRTRATAESFEAWADQQLDITTMGEAPEFPLEPTASPA